MVKVFRGFRFDDEVYDVFCSVASKHGLTATGALEHYMKDCASLDMLFFADRRVLDFEAEARVLVDWLCKGKYYYHSEDGEELSVSGRLLALLPKVADPQLKKNIEETLIHSVPAKE